MNILDILSIGSKILDRVLPDPAQRAAAQLEMFKAQQAGEFKEYDNQLQRDLGQIAVNKSEAESSDFFRGGWRPFAGWICGAGLAYEFILQPLFSWFALIKGWPTPPILIMNDLMALLAGMLGLGGMRTAERLNGVIGPSK